MKSSTGRMENNKLTGDVSRRDFGLLLGAAAVATSRLAAQVQNSAPARPVIRRTP